MSPPPMAWQVTIQEHDFSFTSLTCNHLPAGDKVGQALAHMSDAPYPHLIWHQAGMWGTQRSVVMGGCTVLRGQAEGRDCTGEAGAAAVSERSPAAREGRGSAARQFIWGQPGPAQGSRQRSGSQVRPE